MAAQAARYPELVPGPQRGHGQEVVEADLVGSQRDGGGELRGGGGPVAIADAGVAPVAVRLQEDPGGIREEGEGTSR